MTKSVEYSYPTSDNAKRFGFYDSGCWVVETQDGTNPPTATKGFPTRHEAIAAARSMDAQWSPLFIRFNPTECA